MLKQILAADEALEGSEAEVNFHRTELEYVVVLRLINLCDANCPDLALNYAKSCLRCLPPKETRQQVHDIYLALFLILDEMDECIEEMRRMSLKEGLEFIRRNKPKKDHESSSTSEINKFLVRACEVANSLFLSIAVATPLTTKDDSVTYLHILSEWMTLKKASANFSYLLREVFGLAVSSQHLYYCAQIIERGMPDSFINLAIEIFIRGLNLDINEIEMKKYDGEVKADHIVRLEAKLSVQYLKLSELFNYNEHVRRECLLTAFSLGPRKEIYERLERFRIKSEEETEEECELSVDFDCTHPIIEATSPVSKIYCKYCGNYRDPTDDTKADILLNSETLSNVPAYLHNDLIVVLESPRIKNLSWSSRWPELARNCRRLMDEGEKHKICSQYLISSNDHLQFLDLDYSLFQHLPEGEYPGIEKGYEQFLEEEEGPEGGDDSDSSSSSDDDGKPKNGESGKKRPKYYYEDSESDDYDGRPMPMLKKKKRGRNERDRDRLHPVPRIRNSTTLRSYVYRNKTNIPFKKRIVNKLKPGKPKIKFDYSDEHARFYICVRKAQLDVKKQRIRLMYSRSNKAIRRKFYEVMTLMKAAPARTELINEERNRPIKLPPRPKEEPKPKEKKEKAPRQTAKVNGIIQQWQQQNLQHLLTAEGNQQVSEDLTFFFFFLIFLTYQPLPDDSMARKRSKVQKMH